ncbi:MAG: PaaX family transcriptional regulator [Myxococcota bacterium]
MEASRAILGLLSAESTLSARALADAGDVLGIAPNAVRVALSRLKQRGVVRSPARGVYTMGPSRLRARVERWRDRHQQLAPWAGGWIAVHTAGLGRSDRSELAQRSRALRLLGFIEVAAELHARPDNLVGGRAAVVDELKELGLSPDTPVLDLRTLDAELVRVAVDEWNAPELEAAYAEQTESLQEAETRIRSLPLGEAAALSFALGDAAIRRINRDPLLPEDYVDAHARERFFLTMLRFDQIGRAHWNRILAEVAA